MKKFDSVYLLKKYRQVLGISQSELARKTGFSEAAIAKIENAIRSGKNETWEKIFNYLLPMMPTYIDYDTLCSTIKRKQINVEQKVHVYYIHIKDAITFFDVSFDLKHDKYENKYEYIEISAREALKLFRYQQESLEIDD